jgi:hypothetical protein
MKIRYSIFGIMFGLVSFLVCCKKSDTTPTVVSCSTALPDSISFRRDVLPILAKCSLPACHIGGRPKGNLNLEAASAYAQLRQPGSGYLNSLKPESSVLYISITNNSQPMPPTGKIPDCEIAILRKWMVQGSMDN